MTIVFRKQAGGRGENGEGQLEESQDCQEKTKVEGKHEIKGRKQNEDRE